MEYNHFVTGDFKPHASYMEDEDYAKVLDNVVITCVDCVLVNDKKEMLIGKRVVEPQSDWWIIGGRMNPGESFEITAMRNLKRELSLIIDPSRFHYLETYSCVWARRAQSPKENGSHTVSITMLLLVNNVEITTMKPNDEYEKLQWIRPEDVIVNPVFHPALVKYAEDVITKLKLEGSKKK